MHPGSHNGVVATFRVVDMAGGRAVAVDASVPFALEVAMVMLAVVMLAMVKVILGIVTIQ